MATSIESKTDWPATWTQADTLSATISLEEYSAAIWALEITIRHDNGNHYKYVSTASGTDHAFSIPSSETSQWQPGNYGVQKAVRLISSGEVQTLSSGGRMEVRSAFALQKKGKWQHLLEVVDALIEKRMSEEEGIEELNTGGGFNIVRIDSETLMRIRNKISVQAMKERSAARITQGRLGSETRIKAWIR